jgi:hypothetical protein
VQGLVSDPLLTLLCHPRPRSVKQFKTALLELGGGPTYSGITSDDVQKTLYCIDEDGDGLVEYMEVQHAFSALDAAHASTPSHQRQTLHNSSVAPGAGPGPAPPKMAVQPAPQRFRYSTCEVGRDDVYLTEVVKAHFRLQKTNQAKVISQFQARGPVNVAEMVGACEDADQPTAREVDELYGCIEGFLQTTAAARPN